MDKTILRPDKLAASNHLPETRLTRSVNVLPVSLVWRLQGAY